MPLNLSAVGQRSTAPPRRRPHRGPGVYALLLLLPLSLTGCDLTTLPGFYRHFPEHRLYTYDFFDSHEECARAQPFPDFWLNCSQTANFCPGGRAELMVTDIIHSGTYRVEGRHVTIFLRENPEVESRVRFVLAPDAEAMTERSSGTVWKRKRGEELAEARRSCFFE